MQCNAMQSNDTARAMQQCSIKYNRMQSHVKTHTHTVLYHVYSKKQQGAAKSSQEQPGHEQPEAARSNQKPGEVTEGGLYTAMDSNAEGNSNARAMLHITLECKAICYITSHYTAQ